MPATPAAPAAPSGADRLAAAVRRAGVLWVRPAGADRDTLVWHLWQDGAAWVLTGPGEQRLDLPDGARSAVVTTPTGPASTPAVWTADARVVAATEPAFAAVLPALLAARLNPPDGPAAAGRWAATCRLVRLAPAAGPAPGPGPA